MAVTDTSEEIIVDYRRMIFEEMGFTALQAGILATVKSDSGWAVDTHDVRKVIDAGCSHELAMRIFRETR